MVVERQSDELKDIKNNSSVSSLKIANYKEEPVRRVASPSNNYFGIVNELPNLTHSTSLPSLVHDATLSLKKKNEFCAPPIPPRTDLFLRNSSCKKPCERGLGFNRSMNSLLFDVDLKSLISTNTGAAFNTSSKLPKKLMPELISKNNTIVDTKINNFSNDLSRNVNFDLPLATSSPIPRSSLSPTNLPSYIPILNSSFSSGISTSLEPQSTAPLIKKDEKFFLVNKESSASIKLPPPVAPKPKVIYIL